jgi:hypothetical protein
LLGLNGLKDSVNLFDRDLASRMLVLGPPERGITAHGFIDMISPKLESQGQSWTFTQEDNFE